MIWNIKIKAPLALGLSLSLVGSAVAFSHGDSLITQSFLENTYLVKIQEAINYSASMVANRFLEEKSSELDEFRQDYSTQGMGNAEELKIFSMSYGVELSLPQGSVFVALSDSLTMEKLGALIDLTTGAESETLVSGHQYLVAENSSVTVRGGVLDATVGVRGLYEVGEYETAVVPSFQDVYATDWYFTGVEFVNEKGFFNGVTATEFAPNQAMSRAMVMTVFYRMAGSPVSELNQAQGNFNDIFPGDWYEPYVYWGVSRNLTSGMGDGGFHPDASLTRQQVMVMLYAFAKDSIGMDMNHFTTLSGFADGDEVAVWAEEQMAWAVSRGLFNNIPDSQSYLKGEQVATRGEVATMLMNFHQTLST